MTTIQTEHDSAMTNKQYISTECAVPLYSLSTRGSHPLVLCQLCIPEKEDKLKTKPTLGYNPIATSQAISQATTQATTQVTQ